MLELLLVLGIVAALITNSRLIYRVSEGKRCKIC
ncbi:hypothetical protein PZ873_001007 [Klebsiella pneumoniae]|nr:hypothetical protein [Klebsiella pneumoniae]